MTDLKDLVRPPFANYDIVVYFGGGLFFLPFFQRYVVEPDKIRLPAFDLNIGTKISSEAVSILSLMFSVYIIGHILSFLSSHVVEKTIDRYLGKVSSAIIISSMTRDDNRNDAFRSMAFARFSKIKSDRAVIVTSIRTLMHVPIMIHYFFMFILGVFGYYNTRISPDLMKVAREKFHAEIVPGTHMAIRTPWFKSLEYFVINRYPSAVPRMYNYLVIAGLFRVLCIIFLFSSWMVVYYLIHYSIDGHWLLRPIMNYQGRLCGIIEFLLMSTLYTFCFFSYIKFQRRYAEEAIMAVCFAKS